MIPITDEMKAGKEPMRTFGDLLQFYQHKVVVPADGQPPSPAEQPAVAVEQPPAMPVEQPSAVAELVSAVKEETPTIKEETPASAEHVEIARDEGAA